mmetsp:Transcript_75153/g.224016  ORF Transcript_75153/g.224016 Transcript_75153/m.224016 type:complete len:662 (-) Transcript_75153:1820-3805(-)
MDAISCSSQPNSYSFMHTRLRLGSETGEAEALHLVDRPGGLVVAVSLAAVCGPGPDELLRLALADELVELLRLEDEGYVGALHRRGAHASLEESLGRDELESGGTVGALLSPASGSLHSCDRDDLGISRLLQRPAVRRHGHLLLGDREVPATPAVRVAELDLNPDSFRCGCAQNVRAGRAVQGEADVGIRRHCPERPLRGAGLPVHQHASRCPHGGGGLRGQRAALNDARDLPFQRRGVDDLDLASRCVGGRAQVLHRTLLALDGDHRDANSAINCAGADFGVEGQRHADALSDPADALVREPVRADHHLASAWAQAHPDSKSGAQGGSTSGAQLPDLIDEGRCILSRRRRLRGEASTLLKKFREAAVDCATVEREAPLLRQDADGGGERHDDNWAIRLSAAQRLNLCVHGGLNALQPGHGGDAFTRGQNHAMLNLGGGRHRSRNVDDKDDHGELCAHWSTFVLEGRRRQDVRGEALGGCWDERAGQTTLQLLAAELAQQRRHLPKVEAQARRLHLRRLAHCAAMRRRIPGNQPSGILKERAVRISTQAGQRLPGAPEVTEVVSFQPSPQDLATADGLEHQDWHGSRARRRRCWHPSANGASHRHLVHEAPCASDQARAPDEERIGVREGPLLRNSATADLDLLHVNLLHLCRPASLWRRR